MNRLIISCLCLILLSACSIIPQAPTPTPTRNFTAPTIAPSPTAFIQDSQALYGDGIPVGQNNLTAAALPNTGALPPLASGTREPRGSDTVTLVLADGTTVVGDLYQQVGAVTRVPGVLIIGGQDRLAWGLLPAEIFAQNMTVLVVGLTSANANDLDSLLTSLSELGTVDPARIAVIGANQHADMAVMGCAVVPICDATVLLSPRSRDTLLNILPDYNPRPMFVLTSRADEVSYNAALALSTSYADGSQLVEVAAGQGTNLLSLNSTLNTQIAQWLNQTLQ